MKLCNGKHEFIISPAGNLVCISKDDDGVGGLKLYAGDEAVMALFRHAENLEEQLRDQVAAFDTMMEER